MSKPPSVQPISWLPGSSGIQGGVSVAVSAAMWGLFWIPLRFLDEHGVTGLWAVTAVMAAAVIPAACCLLYFKKLHTLRSFDTCFIASALALSIVLYFVGVIVSDVIRVIFLFYLMPVWTTLTARIVYKEPITPLRLLVIAAALVGLWLLLGGGNNLPLPSNTGDWCGLLAGITWGASLAFIRGKEDVNVFSLVCATSIFAATMSFILGSVLLVLGFSELAATPSVESWLVVVVAAVGFSVLLLFPALLGQVWGAQRIAAPTAALLTMTEVLVATITAYWLIGTELNRVSMLGGSIILIAVLIDIASKYKQISFNKKLQTKKIPGQ